METFCWETGSDSACFETLFFTVFGCRFCFGSLFSYAGGSLVERSSGLSFILGISPYCPISHLAYPGIIYSRNEEAIMINKFGVGKGR